MEYSALLSRKGFPTFQTCLLSHHQGDDAPIIALITDEVSTSETLIRFYHTKRQNIPENSHQLSRPLGQYNPFNRAGFCSPRSQNLRLTVICVFVVKTTRGFYRRCCFCLHINSQSPPTKIFYDKVNTVNIFEEQCNTAVTACNIPAIRDHKIS